MGRNRAVVEQDAAAELERTLGKVAAMRQASDLEATESELVAAAERGELVVKRAEVKLFHADGTHTFHKAGERLPALPPEHSLIAQRLVTTQKRWDDVQRAKQATSYAEAALTLRAELSHANARVQALKTQRAAKQAELVALDKEIQVAEQAQTEMEERIMAFVEAAPIH